MQRMYATTTTPPVMADEPQDSSRAKGYQRRPEPGEQPQPEVKLRNFRRRSFTPAVRDAGLPDGFRIHDLRHTCAALLIAQGAGPKEIASRLGHSSPVVTMNVYAHILPSLDERLTDGLDDTFKKASARL